MAFIRNQDASLIPPTSDNVFHNAHGFDVGSFDPSNGMFQGHKGGLLSTSSNGVNFREGGISYVICWNWQGHGARDTDTDTLYGSVGAESWYPEFRSVRNAAESQDWGSIDLFPQYGMDPL
jgi:hypothetical protein